MVLASLAVSAILAQLTSATIRIDLGQRPVSVEASYRFAEAADTGISFVLLRLPGHEVEIPDHDRAPHHEQRAGLIRLHAVPDPTGDIHIRFRVGPGPRIPIPVPSRPAGRGSVEIRILAPGEVALHEAFPHFALDKDGSLVARLGAVPSVVQLPVRSGWPVLRWLDWLVVAMVAGATAGWAAWTRRERGRS
jgi:hypothetical protein